MMNFRPMLVIRSYLNIAIQQKFTRNVLYYSTESLKSWDEIPGPKALPFIGPLHNFFPGGIFYKLNGNQIFEKLYDHYGPIIKLHGSFGRPDMVFIFDPEYTAQVLRAEDTMPTRPGFQSMEYYRHQYKKRKISGLLTDSGPIWKQFRTKVNPVMLQPKTIKLYKNAIDEVARDMITRLILHLTFSKLFTSNTVTAMLYLLAVNPKKQDRLREEIILGKEKKFLKACIKEALRMIPVVAGNMRIVNKEYNLFGYRIPKGSRVGFAHQAMSNMEINFNRSKEFIPERWIISKDDPLYYGQAHPFAYTPFGFGTRSCIGRRIAELEMETFVTRLVENFRIEWTGPPPKIVSTSLNYMAGPFGFKLIDV